MREGRGTGQRNDPAYTIYELFLHTDSHNLQLGHSGQRRAARIPFEMYVSVANMWKSSLGSYGDESGKTSNSPASKTSRK